MIQEDYVSFEQAKKLKELGFNVPCYTFYDVAFPKDGKPQFVSSPYCHNHNVNPDYDGVISAPTLSLVTKWLREEKDIDIIIDKATHGEYFYNIIQNEPQFSYQYWKKYEEALSEGIDTALELINK